MCTIWFVPSVKINSLDVSTYRNLPTMKLAESVRKFPVSVIIESPVTTIGVVGAEMLRLLNVVTMLCSDVIIQSEQ